MGTNTDTTASISRIAYAAALRDDSDAAEARRGMHAAAHTAFCDLCARPLKPGTTCKAAYAYGDGRLRDASEDVMEDPNVFEILIGNDCAREVPGVYLLDWTIPEAKPEPDMRQLLSIAADLNEANLREIADGANAAASEVAEAGAIVLDPTGALITDTVGRIWLEMTVRPGTEGDWTGGWYSNDGHVAQDAADVFAGEDAWSL